MVCSKMFQAVTDAGFTYQLEEIQYKLFFKVPHYFKRFIDVKRNFCDCANDSVATSYSMTDI